MEDFINNIIAPRIQADGGWVEFVSYSASRQHLTLIFRAECSKCIALARCCDWIRAQIKQQFDLIVTISAVPQKPFFWDR
ncbi:NifU family protein [Oscillospiraceae bacterium HV4-5-C5C]|nr:NifU family protein [Oscillospiraceae bacterium HV4-5-C5C]